MGNQSRVSLLLSIKIFALGEDLSGRRTDNQVLVAADRMRLIRLREKSELRYLDCYEPFVHGFAVPAETSHPVLSWLEMSF